MIPRQRDSDKIYQYTKDPYQAKYQLLINKLESVRLKNCDDSKASAEYLKEMDGIYENIEEYKSNKKWKLLISFDDMIANVLSNKTLQRAVTKLFIRGRKLSISLVFRLNSKIASINLN